MTPLRSRLPVLAATTAAVVVGLTACSGGGSDGYGARTRTRGPGCGHATGRHDPHRQQHGTARHRRRRRSGIHPLPVRQGQREAADLELLRRLRPEVAAGPRHARRPADGRGRRAGGRRHDQPRGRHDPADAERLARLPLQRRPAAGRDHRAGHRRRRVGRGHPGRREGGEQHLTAGGHPGPACRPPGRAGRMVGREASGCLVAPAVFKTDVAEDLGQAGSIPVRLRQARRCLRVASSSCACARSGGSGMPVAPSTESRSVEFMATPPSAWCCWPVTPVRNARSSSSVAGWTGLGTGRQGPESQVMNGIRPARRSVGRGSGRSSVR